MNRYQKLFSLPLREIWKVIAYKTRVAVKEHAQRVHIKYLGKLGITRRSRPKASFSDNVRFFCIPEFPERRTAFDEIIRTAFPDAIRQTVEAADKYCRHIFDLLGSGPTFLGYEIDWHRDFKSGYKWPVVYFDDLPTVNLSDASDIKVPWDLSRFHHALTLGKAYFWTRDNKYCQEFLGQFESWDRNNKVYYGVNWRIAMEAAIRAVNWIWAYYLMRESPLFTRDRQNRLAASLYEHGRYIFNNLEFDKRVVAGKYQPVNGNHYLSNLIGLAYIGLVLEGREPKRWLDFAKSELIEEIRQQFLFDGVHWELSTNYHRLVTEMCFSVVVLLSQNGIEFPAEIQNRLINALAFIKAYTRPDGLAPLIRDADDGRLYVFDQRDFRDHRHLLALGAVLFDRPDLLFGDDYSEETLWLLGTDSYSRYQRLITARTKRSSQGFENAGYYFLRGNRFQAIATCADVGMMGVCGGHAHSDCLSFELSLGTKTLITDCGSFVYSASPEWRNRFRSTEFHNTVRVDSTEINRTHPSQLFSMENDARPVARTWSKEDDFVMLVAEHYGYLRLTQPLIHRRTFFLDKELDTFIIEDVFEGGGEHLFEAFFHLAPDVQPELASDCVRLGLGTGNGLVFVATATPEFAVSIQAAWVSERYGRKRETGKIVFSGRTTAPLCLRYGFAEGQDEVAIKNLKLSLEKFNQGKPSLRMMSVS